MHPLGVSIIQSEGSCHPTHVGRVEKAMERHKHGILVAWMAVFEHEDAEAIERDLKEACGKATKMSEKLIHFDMLTVPDALSCITATAGMHGLHEVTTEVAVVRRKRFPYRPSVPKPPTGVYYACLWVPAHSPICAGNFRVSIETDPFDVGDDKVVLALHYANPVHKYVASTLESDLRSADVDAVLARAIFFFRHNV